MEGMISSQIQQLMEKAIKESNNLETSNTKLIEENTTLYQTLNNIAKIIYNDNPGVVYSRHYLLESSEEILDDLRTILDSRKTHAPDSADVWKLRFDTTRAKLIGLRKDIDRLTDALNNHTGFQIGDTIDFERLNKLCDAIGNKSNSAATSSPNLPSEDFRALSESIEQLVTRLNTLESKISSIDLALLRGKYQERLESLEKQNR